MSLNLEIFKPCLTFASGNSAASAVVSTLESRRPKHAVTTPRTRKVRLLFIGGPDEHGLALVVHARVTQCSHIGSLILAAAGARRHARNASVFTVPGSGR